LEQLGLIGIPDAGGPWDLNVLQGYGFQPNPNVQARAEVPIGNIGNVSNLTQPLGGLNLSTDQSGDDNESSESEDGNTITESPKSEPVSSPADLRLPTVEYGDLTVHTQFIPTMRGLSCVIGGQTYRVVNAPADVTNDPQNRLFAGAATSTPVSSKTVGGTRRKSEKILGLSPREDLILAAKTRSELRQKEAEKQKKEATNLPDVDLNAVSFNVQKTPYRDNSRDKVKCQECEKRKRSASGQRSSSNSYQNRGRSPGNRDSGNSYQKRDNSYQNRGRSPGNRDSGNSYQKRDNSYQNRGRSPGNRDSGNSYQKRDNSYQNRGRSPGNRDSGNSNQRRDNSYSNRGRSPGNRDSGNSNRNSGNSYQERGRSPGNSYPNRGRSPGNSYQTRGRSPGGRDSGNSQSDRVTRSKSRDNSLQSRKFYPEMVKGENCGFDYNPVKGKSCRKCSRGESHHEFQCYSYPKFNKYKCTVCGKFNHYASDCKEVSSFPPKTSHFNSTEVELKN
jgi:hypothetical protein